MEKLKNRLLKYCSIFFVLCSFLFVKCSDQSNVKTIQPKVYKSWAAVESGGKNSSVQMMMWQGDPLINAYMQNFVIPRVKELYGIDLKINPGQGTEIVKQLMTEKEANVSKSSIDLAWINGETFFQLKQLNTMFGPFVELLPNSQYIDLDNPFIGTDFQQKTDGYECPWGNVQYCTIYDSLRTAVPPQDLAELSHYLKLHPGKFTIPYEFTGMTMLKSWMVALSEDKNFLNGPFDEDKYNNISNKLWNYINENKQNFWRNGKTFPENLSQLHQLFINHEIDFTMSNNDCEVDNKIIQKLFPPSTRAYVMKFGSIQNSHYLGIAAGSANTAGAMMVINFLISPEAQLKKYNPEMWGDGTILTIDKLPMEWRNQFANVTSRKYSPKRVKIEALALQEPDPEYMIRLYRDFRTKVIEN